MFFMVELSIFWGLTIEVVCVCDKLVESFEDFRFNMRDCDESFRCLFVSDDDWNRIRDILRRYYDKRFVLYYVKVKSSFEGFIVIFVE